MTAVGDRRARSRARHGAGGGWPAVAITVATVLCLLEALAPAATVPVRPPARNIPVVAPRSGTITYVEYQKGSAGWYVVLDADGENFDYAFMHLMEGSIPVVKGEHVDQGQLIGSVGHTGDAEGDHLHFEMWDGPWYNGGHPVDPLPYLQQWQQWSPVRAT